MEKYHNMIYRYYGQALTEGGHNIYTGKDMDCISIWLDDIRTPPIGYEWFKDAESLIEWIKANKDKHVHVMSLDNDLGAGKLEGRDVVKTIEELEYTDKSFNMPDTVLVHSANNVAASEMNKVLHKIYGHYYKRKGII